MIPGDLSPALPLPLRMKAWNGETVYSFASRLENRLKATSGAIRHVAYANVSRLLGRRAMPSETTLGMARLCEHMCCLEAGMLDPVMGNQPYSSHMCRECVDGCTVEYTWEGLGYTCPLHHRWIAPGPSGKRPSTFEPHPAGPYSLIRVGHDVVEADLRIQALLAEGRVSRRLLEATLQRINSSRRQEQDAVPRPGDLAALADIMSVVTDPVVQSAVLDETLSFAERYSSLCAGLEAGVPACTPELCDDVWLLFRPTAVYVRTTFLGEPVVDPFEPYIIPIRSPDSCAVGRPLEPFRRSMDCLRTLGREDEQWWIDRYVVAVASRGLKPLLICNSGHVQRMAKAHARRRQPSDFGCPVCSGKRTVAGLNSLGDVKPILLSEWDHSVNGRMTAFMVPPGSNTRVGWICPQGHKYPASVVQRALIGTGCPVCSGLTRLPGFNDFATEYPKLASLWDDRANGPLKPFDIRASNNSVEVHLRCPNEHMFKRTPAYLVRTSGRCPTCAGDILIPGVNDLATLRPDAAAWWHPTRNGSLTPQMVKPDSGLLVWWQCPDRHEFPSPVNSRCRTAKMSCSVDNGRYLVTGVNDVATKEPNLVKDWDTTSNHVSPSHTVRTKRKWCWTCQFGHTQEATVAQRHSSAGCTECAPENRVARPQWKFNRGRNGWDKRRLNRAAAGA